MKPSWGRLVPTGRTRPRTAMRCLRAIHRFASANSVWICAVFLASARPRARSALAPRASCARPGSRRRRRLLLDFAELIASPQFPERARHPDFPRAFTRSWQLPLPAPVVLLLSMRAGSQRAMLDG